MSSVGVPDGSSIELLGTIRSQPEPGYREPEQVSVAATITDEGEGLKTERAEDRVRLVDADGTPVGFELASYSLVPSIEGLYEIHSGVIAEDEAVADVFAISDFVEIALGGAALAACLAIYAGQFWVIKQTLDDYRRHGWIPKIKIKSGLLKAVTCQFEVDITALNPAGKVVRSKKVRIGRRGK